MKEHIYTIPINDAFDKDCECPICEYIKNEEKNLVDYTLGGSMMEPDERIVSNKTGFCNHHFSMLMNHENKLSLALVLETHLAEIRKLVDGDFETVTDFQKKLFKKDNTVEDVVSRYKNINDGCVICNKLNKITDKFISNILTLYKNEDEFRIKFESCKGFCLPHFTMLVSCAEKTLSANKLKQFYAVLYEMESRHLARIQEDITWFTKKFDFRFANEDWKNSKDAIPRTVEKISGYITAVKE